MTDPGLPAHDLADYERFIEFFDQAVMAAYLQQSDRFVVKTDHFEGHLSSRDDGTERDDWIDIRFGYRTLSSGDLAIAVFRPHLYEKSATHVPRWVGFRLQDPSWATPDERYSLWLRRYFDAEWGVESGPRVQLEGLVATINALTAETVGLPLIDPHECEALTFPLAQNTHRYQDAHLVLYGFLVDGLQKDCIVRIGAKAGVALNVASDKTVGALRKIPGVPESDSPLWAAFENTSQQRWLAGHKTRPTATRFAAFEGFSEDLKQWVAGLRELLSCLEKVLGMKGSIAAKRHTAKQHLPVIVAPPEANYSIATLPRIEGKTVARVECGLRRKHPKLHQSEAMILHFTDGSSLGIETGSNIGNLSHDHEQLDPTAFHVDFILQWVPAPDGRDATDT
jgi:hypothetical protein